MNLLKLGRLPTGESLLNYFLIAKYWTAAATVVGGALSARSAKKSARNAAGVQGRAADAATAEQRRQFDVSQAQAEPFRQRGLDALAQQSGLLGLGGQAAQDQAFQQFQDSPGQQFIRDRQQRSLLRNSAAIGGLGGGNVRTALQQQATGFAQQDLQNQLARLGSIAGQGQAVTSNIARLGANTAGNVGNLMQAGGQAQASGILGAGAAQSRLFNQVGGALAGQFASTPSVAPQGLGAGISAGLGAGIGSAIASGLK